MSKTLFEYVIAYLNEEHSRMSPTERKGVGRDEIDVLINLAIDSYQGGAR